MRGLALFIFLIAAMAATAQTGFRAAAVPSRIDFKGTAGVIAEIVETLTVLSEAEPRNCTLSVTHTSQPFFDVLPRSGTTPFQVRVVATAGFVATAQYGGQIRIACDGNLSQVVVPVSLDAFAQNQMLPSADFLEFRWQRGLKRVARKAILVRGSGVAVGFQSSLVDRHGGIFDGEEGLFVTPRTLILQVDTRSTSPLEPPQSRNSGFFLTPQFSNTFATIASLNTQLDPSGAPTVPSLEFHYQRGGLLPDPKPLDFLADNGPAPFNLDIEYDSVFGLGQLPEWLTLNRNQGVMPQSVTVGVNPEGLPDGTYQARIQLRHINAPDIPVVRIPVTFAVGTGSVLSVPQRLVNFTYQLGSVIPEPQTLPVANLRGGRQYLARVVSPFVRPWLRVEPELGTAPQALTLTVEPEGLGPSNYDATVEIWGAGMNDLPVRVPVRLSITDQLLIQTNVKEIEIAHQPGTEPRYTRLVQFTAPFGGPAAKWKADVVIANPVDKNWLTLSAYEGTAPWSLGVYVDTTGLAPGRYRATVYFRIDELYDAYQVLPVTVTIPDIRPMAVDRTLVPFFKEPGAPNPGPQEITISTTGRPFEVQLSDRLISGGNWLEYSPNVGATPVKVRLNVNRLNTLGPGRYQQELLLTPLAAGVEPLRVMAEFRVGFRLNASPESLEFAATTTTGAPPPRNLVVSSGSGPREVRVAVFTDLGGSWLRAVLGTPGVATVSVQPDGLPPGRYAGRVVLTSDDTDPLTVPVSLTVTAGTPATNLAVVNGASFAAGPVAPGTLVTLFGANLGPEPGLAASVPTGEFPISLGQTEVLFEEVRAPLVYVSRLQTTAVVPYEMAGRSSARVRVVYRGVTFYDQTVPLAPSSPGIFTAASNGRGQAAVLNQNGSPNSASNPAARGSVIQIFATGGGVTVPASATGAIATDARALALSVSVQIGGQPAVVEYAGSAPGLINGIMQINARVPLGAPPGEAPIVVTVGTASSASAGATVAIR